MRSMAVYADTVNLPPSSDGFARDGDVVSATVCELIARSGECHLALHDCSGRVAIIPYEELQLAGKRPVYGDRFSFTLHICTKTGQLSASRITWLPPGTAP